MKKLIVFIFQEDFSTESAIEFANTLTQKQVANFCLNTLISYMNVQKQLVSPKNRAKLNQPFTFVMKCENGSESFEFPDFQVKLSLTQASVGKLVEKFPIVLKELLMPNDVNMNPVERFNLINSKELSIVADNGELAVYN